MEHKRRMCIVACAVMAIEGSRNPKRNTKRHIWHKNWLAKRGKYAHISLLRELRENNPDYFKNYIRIDGETFHELSSLMRLHLSKQDTPMRRSIPVDQRLKATLRFLATGGSYEDIKFTTGISAQVLERIIPETCQAFYEVLHTGYLKLPSSKEEWTNVSRGFNSPWQMPNCGGAIDGKHIRIMPPSHSGALYYNSKNLYSIVLMAFVNAHYEFVYVDVAKNGPMSDGGVLEHTTFFTHLTSDRLNLPDSTECNSDLDFVFRGDEAFPLYDHILKPFLQRNLTHDRVGIYNYKLSRGRNVVENVFGLIAARFRLLHTPINVAVDKVYSFIIICVLHNFLTENGGYAFDSVNERSLQINSNVEWRENQVQLLSLRIVRHSTYFTAKENRDKYFNGEGAVSWQELMLIKGRT